MIGFYVTKILNKEINVNTGEVWKIEDVPSLWKAKVDNYLKAKVSKEEINNDD